MGAIHELWQRTRDRVAFYVVYIKEAHPEDGWVVNSNRDDGIRYVDPTSIDERADVAGTCSLRLDIQMPVLIDELDDGVAEAYGALPDRLYLVAKGGDIAYQGEPGPWGFDPSALGAAIDALLER